MIQAIQFLKCFNSNSIFSFCLPGLQSIVKSLHHHRECAMMNAIMCDIEVHHCTGTIAIDHYYGNYAKTKIGQSDVFAVLAITATPKKGLCYKILHMFYSQPSKLQITYN